MKTKNSIETLEAMLVRVHPATRTSSEDAKLAGESLRIIARESGFLGGLVNKSTGKFDERFVKLATGVAL